MSSSTVRAQKLANEANIAMTSETNQANRDIAAAQNALNYKMFNEQNQWNLERRKEEWDYNSPSSQMQRYMEAGINPLWAMTGGDPGTAQQLTSASPQAAVGATMQAPNVMPEYDPSRLSSIVAAANNVSNSLQGFLRLGLEAEDVATRRGAMQSQAALNVAEGMYKRSQTQSQELFNNLTSRTFDTQVGIKVAEYQKLLSEIDYTKSGSEVNKATAKNLSATHEQIIAQTKYVTAQQNALIEQVRQGWQRLRIEQQQADTGQFSAYSASFYQGEQLKQNERQFQFSVQKAYADFSLQSNAQIVDWLDKQRGSWEKVVGVTQSSGQNLNENVLRSLEAAGKVLSERLQKDPSDSNLKSFNDWLKTVDSLPVVPPSLIKGNLQNYSVLNPSVPWQQ